MTDRQVKARVQNMPCTLNECVLQIFLLLSEFAQEHEYLYSLGPLCDKCTCFFLARAYRNERSDVTL